MPSSSPWQVSTQADGNGFCGALRRWAGRRAGGRRPEVLPGTSKADSSHHPAGVPTPALSSSGDHPHPGQKGGQRGDSLAPVCGILAGS